MAIKETVEVFDLIDGIANFVREAKVDGVIDFKDLPKALPLISLSRDAISGSGIITVELKAMNSEEMELVIDGLIRSVTNLVDSVLA